MTIEERLKELILFRYGTILNFSTSLGIPNSTVASVFYRGVKNTSVSNLSMICEALQISMDGLLEGQTISLNEEDKKKNEDMTIADRIRERRIEMNMSQDELAKKLGLESRSSITRIEKSGDDVSIKDIVRISEALRCPISQFIGSENLRELDMMRKKSGAEELQEKDELREIVRNNLIDLRKKKNITQLKLARMIDKSANAVASWEQGLSLPDAVMLYRLSIFYSVKMEYFFEDHKKGGEPK